MPFASRVPQAAGQAAPAKLQRTERFGWPLLLIEARNASVAPSSTPAEMGLSRTAMSLRMVTVADACLLGSARLCAVTVSVVEAGKIGGAVKLPLASSVPHVEGQAAPEMLHRTAVSGRPLLLTVARKVCTAPRSTPAVAGVSATARSLVMVTVAVADLVASATLVAVICAVTDAGRSAGAVYTPAALMAPALTLPPAIPFTLQVTLVSVAFVTVALKVCVLPSTTEALPGVIVTVMEAGGGGGGGGSAAELAPPPPQPSMHALAARRTERKAKTGMAARVRGGNAIVNFPRSVEGGRIRAELQAKGQRRKLQA